MSSMKRTILRNIARNRLIDAGYERPNKRLSMTAKGGRKHAQAVERYHRGWKTSRKRLAYINMIRKEDPQIWRRVLCGDLSRKFRENSKKVSLRRALAAQALKIHRGEAWQPVK